jgi:hypothetical protein
MTVFILSCYLNNIERLTLIFNLDLSPYRCRSRQGHIAPFSTGLCSCWAGGNSGGASRALIWILVISIQEDKYSFACAYFLDPLPKLLPRRYNLLAIILGSRLMR